MDESVGMGAASRVKSNRFVARVLPWIIRKGEFPTTSFGVTRGPRSTVEEAAGPPHMWTVHGSFFSPIPDRLSEPACAPAKFAGPPSTTVLLITTPHVTAGTSREFPDDRPRQSIAQRGDGIGHVTLDALGSRKVYNLQVGKAFLIEWSFFWSRHV